MGYYPGLEILFFKLLWCCLFQDIFVNIHGFDEIGLPTSSIDLTDPENDNWDESAILSDPNEESVAWGDAIDDSWGDPIDDGWGDPIDDGWGESIITPDHDPLPNGGDGWGNPVPIEDTYYASDQGQLPETTNPPKYSTDSPDHLTTTTNALDDMSIMCLGVWVSCGPCVCCYHGNTVRTLCEGKGITNIPTDLPENITHLTIQDTKMEVLEADRSEYFPKTKFLIYPKLVELVLKDNYEMSSMDIGSLGFNYNGALESLWITGSPKLSQLQAGVLGKFAKLSNIKINHCGLTKPPDWSLFDHGSAAVIDIIDLSHNNIQSLEKESFSEQMKIGSLVMQNTNLKDIQSDAFNGATIGKLFLSDNEYLEMMGEFAFRGIKQLDHLDLSRTSIRELPTPGLDKLTSLVIENTFSLQSFPLVLDLGAIEQARLTYAHHCCAFAHPEIQNTTHYEIFMEEMQRECASTTLQPTTTQPLSTLQTIFHTTSSSFHGNDGFGSFAESYNVPRGVKSILRKKRGFGDIVQPNVTHTNSPATEPLDIWHTKTLDPSATHISQIRCGEIIKIIERNIDCTPEPDAFNPCEDVMGYPWLRVIAWVVVITAILGNLAVIIVTLGSKHKLSVSKFLMCNLATADLVLGLYLMLLAASDAHSIGRYFTQAIHWQYNGGCQAAGFLATFSACLSVFTLTVITLERWYAISYAMNANKRLRLRQAAVIMNCGWLFSIIMAILPLVGVSDFSKTSICLPMETAKATDQGYIITLMLVNAGCFIIILVCYIDMYRKVRTNSDAAGRGDAKIAKRMAALVFTDFLCLFPIVFFGLTAALGSPLINVTNSKVLLVFFFPLNSCANPFLYAIITKNFLKDLFGMLNRCGFCEKRAAKYRLALTSNPMTMSHSRGSLSGPSHNMIHRPSMGSTQTTCNIDHNKGSKASINNTLNGSISSETTPKDSIKSFPQMSMDMNGYNQGITSKETAQHILADKVPLELRKLSVVIEGSLASGASDQETRIDQNESHLNGSDQDIQDDMNDYRPFGRRVRSVSEYSDKPLLKYLKTIESFDDDRRRRMSSDATVLTNISESSIPSPSPECQTRKSHGSLFKPLEHSHKGSVPGDSGFGDVDGTSCDPLMNNSAKESHNHARSDSMGSVDVFYSMGRQKKLIMMEKENKNSKFHKPEENLDKEVASQRPDSLDIKESNFSNLTSQPIASSDCYVNQTYDQNDSC